MSDGTSITGQPQQEGEGPEMGRRPSLLAADIGTVTKAAFQETLAELSTSARKTGVASATAFKRLRQGAEKHLGIEVSIKDPALRDLFGYVVQIENLLAQARASALALLQGAAVLAQGSAGTPATPHAQSLCGGLDGTKPLAESLQMLGQAVGNSSSKGAVGAGSPKGAGGAGGEALPADFGSEAAAALWETLSVSPNAGEQGSARYRMQKRLEEEVVDVIDKQIARHDNLRQLVRERQGWREVLDECHWEVASLHRSGGRLLQSLPFSGLRPLGTVPTCIEEADKRRQAAQAQIAALDAELLTQLLDIKATARQLVARPWIAFSRIRAEFFAALVGQWAPVATTLGEGLDLRPAVSRVSSTASGGGSGQRSSDHVASDFVPGRPALGDSSPSNSRGGQSPPPPPPPPPPPLVQPSETGGEVAGREGLASGSLPEVPAVGRDRTVAAAGQLAAEAEAEAEVEAEAEAVPATVEAPASAVQAVVPSALGEALGLDAESAAATGTAAATEATAAATPCTPAVTVAAAADHEGPASPLAQPAPAEGVSPGLGADQEVGAAATTEPATATTPTATTPTAPPATAADDEGLASPVAQAAVADTSDLGLGSEPATVTEAASPSASMSPPPVAQAAPVVAESEGDHLQGAPPAPQADLLGAAPEFDLLAEDSLGGPSTMVAADLDIISDADAGTAAQPGSASQAAPGFSGPQEANLQADAAASPSGPPEGAEQVDLLG